MRISGTPLERFDARWKRAPSGCWLWTGAAYPTGYGAFSLNQKTVGAHRASWILRRGPVPKDRCVLHHCDVRACVNPDHLFLGTLGDNIQDMVKKGRQAKGECHGTKTHPEIVRRGERHWTHLHPERVARGNRCSFVKRPWTRPRGAKHWTHRNPEKIHRGPRSPDQTKNYRRGNLHHAWTLSEKQRALVRRLFASGWSGPRLAARFKVTKPTIYRIVKAHSTVVR